MSFFKKIGRSIGNAFKSVPGAVTSIFKKAPGVINQVAGGLGKVGDVLGSVADIGGKILSNPLTDVAASALLGPEAGLALGAAGQGLNAIRKGSQIAKGASSVAGSRNVSEALGGIQKLKDIAGVAGPSFA